MCKYLFKYPLSIFLAEGTFEDCQIWVAWPCLFIQVIYMNNVFLSAVQDASPDSRDTKMDKLGPSPGAHQKDKRAPAQKCQEIMALSAPTRSRQKCHYANGALGIGYERYHPSRCPIRQDPRQAFQRLLTRGQEGRQDPHPTPARPGLDMNSQRTAGSLAEGAICLSLSYPGLCYLTGKCAALS